MKIHKRLHNKFGINLAFDSGDFLENIRGFFMESNKS